MGYIILKLAGSHSLGDPRNLEDAMYLRFIRMYAVHCKAYQLVDCLVHNNTHTVRRHRGSGSECNRRPSWAHQIRLTMVNRVISSSLGRFRFPSSSRSDSIALVSAAPRSPISETGAASSRVLSKISFNSRLYFCTSSAWRIRNTSQGR